MATVRREDERYLDSAERGFLATVGKDGRPTLIPVCFVYDRDTIYTAIDRKPKTGTSGLARLTNISSSPSVAFIADHYSEDWNKLSYLLVHGDARIVTDPGESAEALVLLSMKYPQYRMLTLDQGSAVVAIEVRSSKFWAFRQPVG